MASDRYHISFQVIYGILHLPYLEVTRRVMAQLRHALYITAALSVKFSDLAYLFLTAKAGLTRTSV